MALAISQRLGRYEILAPLGAGGMGEVYRARDEKLGRDVALKVLPAAYASDPERLLRFEQEARAVGALDHPNVLIVHDVGMEGGAPYIVTELLEGETLREALSRGGLTTRRALEVAAELAQGLAAAHERGVIHRDLKPANVFLTRDGRVKVLDFGLAKLHAEVTGPGEGTTEALGTRPGVPVGTLGYMAPEQLRGQKADPRTDVFALGVVLYEMLAGRAPFRRNSAADVVSAILNEDPPRLSLMAHGVSLPLEWLVQRCLEKRPDDRFHSAHDLAVALRTLSPTLTEPPGPLGDRPPLDGALSRLGAGPRGIVLAVAILLLILGYVAFTSVRQNRGVRWARETALPEAEQAIARDDYTAASKLADQAGRWIPSDPEYLDLAQRTRGTLTLRTDPTAAEILIRDYGRSDAEWQTVGRAPLVKVRVPRGFKRWKASLPGYDPVEGAVWIHLEGSRPDAVLRVRLDKAGTLPPGMVRVAGGRLRPTIVDTLPELKLADFLLDRYETTNRQFKEFVAAGGYRKPEYWKHRFVKEGREITGEAAMRLLVDRTGRPGPSSWELGDYPEGQADYPVAGVSWYEAAAFAEFAGKRLPTVHHWNHAALGPADSDIHRADHLGAQIIRSNFGGEGPAPGGAFQGMTPRGIYDMAGNVKEWAWNETSDGRRIMLGGAWNEQQYMYVNADRYPPFLREPAFGFRCMRLLVDDEASREAARPVRLHLAPASGVPKACSDEAFLVYKKLYEYSKAELRPRLEYSKEVDPYTRLERVSFDAAYGDERMIAYLFLPRSGKPPFQAVIHFPGVSAQALSSTLDYAHKDRMRFLTRTGRAWVIPVMWGTFERRASFEKAKRTSYVEKTVLRVKDFKRTIDYLETRPDIDAGRLAYEGLSWGGWFGGVLPAIEDRLKVAVLFGGGIYPGRPPEFSQFNFAPRIRIPVLMQNGRYDFLFPIESHARPLLRLFGTADRSKELKIYETGHSVWLTNELFRDEVAFLDEHLGPAQ